MLVLDTHAFVYEALDRARLSKRVKRRIDKASSTSSLVISDVTLWEVAMLVAHGRLDPGTRTNEFLEVALEARGVRVLPITPSVAQLSVEISEHGDPADRIIAATAMVHNAMLVTSDRRIREMERVKTIW